MFCVQTTANASTRKKIKQKKQELKVLETDIKKSKKLIQEVKKQEETILEELSTLDKEIEAQWKRLEEARKKWTQVELQLLAAKKNYQKQKKLMETLQRKVESRLRALYKTGTIGILNIIFAAETVPEIFSRQTYLEHLLEHDKEIRKKYIQELNKAKAIKDELQKQSNALKEAALKIEQEALILEAKKKEKKQLLDKLMEEGEGYKNRLAELRKSRESLKNLLKELRKKAKVEQKRWVEHSFKKVMSSRINFVKQKGDLEPPLYGTITKKTPDGKKVRGILIAAPWGSKVRAFYDGKVIYAGSLKGYGNVIILDHGHDFMSLVAQLSVIFSDVGDRVREGDVIGLSGSGIWIPEGIYFELRWKDKALDPIQWINPSWLKMKSN